MYFKRKECPNCNSIHDEMLDYCPFCGQRNDAHEKFKKAHPLTFVPVYKEILLALFGLFGFVILNIVFSYAFNSAYQDNQVRGLMLINTASYLVFFLFVLAMLFPYYKDIFSKFKIGWAYLFGGIGFTALFVFSIVYGNLISIIRPETGTGGNQSAVNSMVLTYPLISVLVVGIIGPICEECAYRIGLFTFLRRIHPVLAYIGTAIIFGLIHFDFGAEDLITELIYLVEYIFAGVTFAFLYDKKGIAASTFAHVLNNMLSIVLILLNNLIV